MVDITVTGKRYRLLAGSPMPIGNAKFILQTFMGEEAKVVNYLYTNTLPDSSDFRGQGGDLYSASFNRLQDTGGDAYTGKVNYNPTFVEER
jgi:hypothetical protein